MQDNNNNNTRPRGEWMAQTDILVELDISRSTLAKWRTEGRGPVFRKLPNGALRIRRRDFDAWVSSLEEVA